LDHSGLPGFPLPGSGVKEGGRTMKLNLRLQSQSLNLSKFAISRLARQYKTLEDLVEEEDRETEKSTNASVENLQRRFD
jgi:hypothetical protein